MTSPALFRLTEDRFLETELSPETVAELLRSPNPLFDFRPTTASGMYRLTAGSRIGTWETPSLKVLVEPKLRDVNLLAMIDPEAVITSHGPHSERGLEESFLVHLAARLGRLMIARARSGLRQDYETVNEEANFLRGKLDIPAQVRVPRPSGDTFHIEYDSFTHDILANQLPKAVAVRLANRMPASSEAAGLLGSGIAAFGNVSTEGLDLRLGFERLNRAILEPADLELISLVEIIWEGFELQAATGPHATLELLDLHQVFERYVATGLVRLLGDCLVEIQRTVLMAQTGENRSAPWIARPDVLISANGRPLLVLDTKWKLLQRGEYLSSPTADDIQQIIAYLHVTGSSFGMLVYPGDGHERSEFAVSGGGTIIRQQVNVTGTCAECHASLSQLAEEIRSLHARTEGSDHSSPAGLTFP